MQLRNYADFFNDWMYLERYVNDGSDHKFKNQTEVPLQFQPNSKNKYIEIYSLLSDFTKEETTLEPQFYPVHPHTALLYRQLGNKVKKTPYKGIPTSSTRTILISNNNFENSYLVKLDLPVTISRFDRSIAKSDVIFSKQINDDLKKLVIRAKKAIGTFSEVGGGYTTLHDGREAGYILRDLTPHWFTANRPNKFFLIPSFSLISHDSNMPSDLPLVIQMIRSSENPVRYVLDNLIFPLLVYWFALAERGLIWELQQQNTLFVVDDNKYPIGILSRDFDGIYIDVGYRKAIGLPNNFIKHKLVNDQDISQRYSLIFDHRLCKQNIARIINCVGQYLGESVASQLRDETKAFIHKKMPHRVRDALPKNVWYTYPEIMFRDGVETVVMAEPPLR